MDFKKAFFHNNFIYEAKLQFRDLKQMGCIRSYMKKFTILTLNIPSLTDEYILFYFIDGLKIGP